GDGGSASPQELILRAQERFQAGQQAIDPAEQRAAFTEAEALLLEAQDRGGRTLDTQSLFNQVAGALSNLDAVVRPATVTAVADLSQFGAQPVTPVDMAAGAGYVFLLDSAASQVIGQPVDGSTASVAYSVDDALGYARPMAIAMMDSGLLVLD